MFNNYLRERRSSEVLRSDIKNSSTWHDNIGIRRRCSDDIKSEVSQAMLYNNDSGYGTEVCTVLKTVHNLADLSREFRSLR
jgi:hypothetical protein